MDKSLEGLIIALTIIFSSTMLMLADSISVLGHSALLFFALAAQWIFYN